MSPKTPSSGDVELRASSRDANADRFEDDAQAPSYDDDEAVFAEDPFSQNHPEPYVTSLAIA